MREREGGDEGCLGWRFAKGFLPVRCVLFRWGRGREDCYLLDSNQRRPSLQPHWGKEGYGKRWKG